MRTEEILDSLRPVLNSGWVGLGPRVEKFEKEVSEKIGAKNVIATSCCTGAIQIALKAIDIPPGSLVATTPVTFVSTNHSILHAGHRPVFLDVNPLTGNIDVSSLKAAIASHDIKALIVVHLAGYPCDMDEINDICRENNIKVIEDCAHAFGAHYKGSPVGSGQNICCWSFQAVKNLPLGDGGAVTTQDLDLDILMRKLRWMGIDKDTISRNTVGYKWEYNVPEAGYRFYMNDIAATIGSVQIKYIDEDNAKRQRIASIYKENIRSGTAPDYRDDRKSSYHFFPFFFSNRKEVYDELVSSDIHPGIHYKLNTRYPMYSESIRMGDLKNAHLYESTEITLPIHTFLTDDDLQKVIDVVNRVGKKA
jgi:perosamine synthetase